MRCRTCQCLGALAGSTLARSGLHYGEKLHDRAVVELICRSETHCSLNRPAKFSGVLRVGLSRVDAIHKVLGRHSTANRL